MAVQGLQNRQSKSKTQTRRDTCARTHTQGTRQYRFMWQYNSMTVSWWQPLRWHPDSAGLWLCSLCVCTVCTHSSVSSSSRLSRLQMAAVPPWDAAFLVMTDIWPCMCVCTLLFMWLITTSYINDWTLCLTVNRPNECACTVDTHTRTQWHISTHIHFSCLDVFWSHKAKCVILSLSILSSKVVWTTAALLFLLPAF